ncbi:hypothetical protein GN244_ATG06098 [Phytophthora infestans]|uniref:WW domain-containing protein n=1 Tax=Phytophthora infestans TaxID=4787 RepID=A0A833WH99_PHYIN|nr:hypothetical protein GN244_ATG06098 [Phytophthora infestans]
MKPARSRYGFRHLLRVLHNQCHTLGDLTARVAGRSDEDDAFGWQLFHDRQRNLVYYLHSYTGEVRWPRPETVGFVMHGLKPLPAQTRIDARTDASVINSDIWSPYYPHVVMLPSGLVQVHPGPDSDVQNATEMWCGYNRFPLRLPKQTSSRDFREPRILPPTWEKSRSGSPFLPPYPVAVLGRDTTEDKRQAAPRPPLQHLDERFQTPEINVSRSRAAIQNGEPGRVRGSMDWPVLSPTMTATTAPDRKQSGAYSLLHVFYRNVLTCILYAAVYPKGFPAPNTEKKEHNRKGYLLRQARKMMRDGGSTSTTTPPDSDTSASTKQRKVQEMTAKARHDLSSRDKLDPLTDNGDFDTITPLHC